jgi:hypothetical protein
MTGYPRETVEFQGVTVTVNGTVVTTGVMFCLVPDGARPVTWVTPTTLSGAIGVMVTGLIQGTWRIFAQVTSSPEVPVIDCGTITVT